jgi:DNA polymerase-3 subunit delta
MQLKQADLAAHLKGDLAPIYLLAGDETLLVQEASEQILAAANAQGFSERKVRHVEPGFKWADLLQDAGSLSLFSDKRVIDVRVPGAKFDREASEVLRSYVQTAGGGAESGAMDTLLLIRSGRLDGKQRKAAWFKAIDSAGAVLQIWPVSSRDLPRWLHGRLDAAGLSLEPDAEQYLAQRIEGNLLAAVQEIEKLKLSEIEQPIALDALARVIEDSSHYDAFELIDAVFAGQGDRVSRILRTLAEEGIAIFALMGALTAQLRLARIGRVPPQRKRLAESFLSRVSDSAIDRLLAECALIDQQAKGQLLGDAWQSFETMLLRMAGLRTVALLGSNLRARRLS